MKWNAVVWHNLLNNISSLIVTSVPQTSGIFQAMRLTHTQPSWQDLICSADNGTPIVRLGRKASGLTKDSGVT